MAPGAGCVFQLRFSPAATVPGGTRASTELRVEYQSIAAPTVAQVESTAAPVAALSVSSTGVSFAAPIQTAAATLQPIVLTNGGQANLILQAPSLAGTAAGDFNLAGACAQATSLAPGAQCELQVSFRPTAAGVRTAQLQLAWDGGATSIALTGTSTTPSSPAAPPPVPGAATTTNSGGGGAVSWLWALVLAGALRCRVRCRMLRQQGPTVPAPCCARLTKT
jgi:hypothetical protein